MPIKTIVNNKGHKILVDEDMYDQLEGYAWQVAKSGHVSRNDYLGGGRKSPKRKTVFIHHLVVGYPPKGMVVDHINGNPMDNRRENLRICTYTQNSANQKVSKSSTSGYKGVCFYSGAWTARIYHNSKRHFLGYFKNKHLAAEAYNKAAKQFFGEYAKLNIIEEDI